MTPQFILLPSGLRISTAHILEYREETPGKTKIVQVYFRASEPTLGIMMEDMTAAELDALLSPTTSAIVSHVLELRKPCIGDAVSFVWEDRHLHGVVDGASMNGYWISSGNTMFEWVPRTCQIILP